MQQLAHQAARERFDGVALTLVETIELTRDYGDVKAVRGISFAVEPGELYCLVGPDGAGKTTAIGCLAGLMHPTSGSVRILDQDPMARGSTARRDLGLMPQEYSLYGDLSVGENLWFFGQLFALKKSVFEKRVERLLAITRLARFVDRRAAALSGGSTRIPAGTPAYASPQVLSGETPDRRDDVFSFACVAYELLTGQHPFRHCSSLEARDSGITPTRWPGVQRSRLVAGARSGASSCRRQQVWPE